MGTFAIGIAGFSAVAAGLRQANPGWTPFHSLRLRAIVSTSLNVTFESVIPLIAGYGLGSAHTAILVSSAISGPYMLAIIALRTPQFIRSDALRRNSTRLMIGAGYLATIVMLSNVLFASVALYALALWFQLLVPAVIFYTLVAAEA